MKVYLLLRWGRALADSAIARWLLGRLFQSLSFAVPFKRLRETDYLMAFFHPQPAYPFHILIVPKKALAGLGDLTPADAAFMEDLFETVNSLVAEYRLEGCGYRLIANGGKFQQVPQLHFHLVAEESAQPVNR